MTASLQQIQVANFSHCQQASCAWGSPGRPRPHLIIQLSVRPIEYDDHVALSYTWGAFDRKTYVLGHDPGYVKSFDIELGSEWDFNDFKGALVRLCTNLEDGYIWIDQVCMPGTTDERKVLAAIPHIYRSLKLAVLFPGNHCGCLNELTAFTRNSLASNRGTLQSGSAPTHAEVFAKVRRVQQQIITSCVSIWGFSSYFTRIWTRQELLYARAVQLIWAAEDEIPCVKCNAAELQATTEALFHGDLEPYNRTFNRPDRDEWKDMVPAFDQADVDRLPTYAKRLYESVRAEGKTHTLAAGDIMGASSDFFHRASDMLYDFYVGPEADGAAPIYAFLLGYSVYRSEATTEHTLPTFLNQLGELGLAARSATRIQDYIAAVWIDCPGYRLPEDWKTTNVAVLLLDAIWQLEYNHKITLPTTNMAPLVSFFASSMAHLALHKEGLDVRFDSRAIYGNLPTRGLRAVPLYNDFEVQPRTEDPRSSFLDRPWMMAPKSPGVPLRQCRAHVQSQADSQRLFSYYDWIDTLQPAQVFIEFCSLLRKWRESPAARIKRDTNALHAGIVSETADGTDKFKYALGQQLQYVLPADFEEDEAEGNTMPFRTRRCGQGGWQKVRGCLQWIMRVSCIDGWLQHWDTRPRLAQKLDSVCAST